MLPFIPDEKFTITPLKAQRILAKHGTVITLEDAEIVLELLRKLSKLSVSEAFDCALSAQIHAPLSGEVKP